MKDFIERWQGHGDEKSDTQTFWLEFLNEVCGAESPGELIEFQKRVSLKHVSFIDAYVTKTRVIIEQKSFDVDLDKPTKQSDGAELTPFEQAKRYSDWLPDSERARWIITCNFQEFHIHDMETPKAPPFVIKLANMEKEWRKFLFIVNPCAMTPKEIHEEEVSIQAGLLVKKLKESLKPRYKTLEGKDAYKSLTVLCVRIVFLLYAEDSGLLNKNQFYDYMKKFRVSARHALIDLFEGLSQRVEQRDFYFDESIKEFPYIDGGLFSEKDNDIEIPQLDGEPLDIILRDMCEGFDWSGINPTIFGSIFESVLDPDDRRSGGMHYTSVENIHKVIDPLFMDELEEEFKRTRSKEKLRKFREKLASLKFFDPACGSGNFLTEAYLSLCRLEMKVINALGEIPILSVSIDQFFGIEINDFAVAVAKTALWISSIQMAQECNPKINLMEQCLPLEKFDKNIIEGNALTLDWRSVIAPSEVNFLMGNPPFVGYSNQNDEQKQELLSIYVDEKGKPYKSAGKIDYVAGWYFKAAEFIQRTKIRAAFVSTNSITQGEQVANVFEPLKERFGIHIDFAWRSFKWSSETKHNAQVHIVIIGFSVKKSPGLKKLFTGTYLEDDVIKYTFIECENINFYLVPGDEIFIKARLKPICEGVPEIKGGNRPADGGHLIINSRAEYRDFIKREPKAKKFIKRYMMGDEFINGLERYCLWLVDTTPRDLRSMKLVAKRVRLCKEDRLKGAPDRQKLADTAWLFRETQNPERYIAIPVVSSGTREYIPIDWLDDSIIPGNKLFIIPDAKIYHFGILTSRVNMAWMRRTAGRLGTGYSYSKTIVYNNFIWPAVNARQRSRIERTAQKILDVRAKFPKNSLADLYSHEFMPKELRKAHQDNDTAVCEAYGWDKDISEEEIVSELMKMYEKMMGV